MPTTCPPTMVIVDAADLEHALPLAWAEIGRAVRTAAPRPRAAPACRRRIAFACRRCRRRRHSRDMPRVAGHRRQGRAARRAQSRFDNFGTEPPPDLRADPRAATARDGTRGVPRKFSGRVLLTADSAGRRELLLEHAAAPGPAGRGQSPTGRRFVRRAALSAIAVAPDVRGLVLPGRGLALVAEDQLFGERARQERRRRRAERDPRGDPARTRRALARERRSSMRSTGSAATAACASCRSTAIRPSSW